jgi:hypothetical protein
MYMISDIMYMAGEGEMAAASSAFLHKHVRIDQAKLDRVKEVLKAKTDTEALDRALGLIVSEAEINAVLRAAGGKGRLRKLFR